MASSLVMCCLRVESGKEILVADIEELEKSSASGIHARRHNAKEVLASSMEMNSKFRAQMERSSWQAKVKKSVHPSQLRIHPTEE